MPEVDTYLDVVNLLIRVLYALRGDGTLKVEYVSYMQYRKEKTLDKIYKVFDKTVDQIIINDKIALNVNYYVFSRLLERLQSFRANEYSVKREKIDEEDELYIRQGYKITAYFDLGEDYEKVVIRWE